MKRVVEEEWLDTDAGTPAEIALNLEDMRAINRRLGGNAMHLRLLRKVVDRVVMAGAGRQLHLLEVAAGNADVVHAAAAELAGDGVSLRVSLLDRSRSHLPDGSHWPSALPPPELHVGDALALPFADRSVDVVSCCLFLHHLEPDEAARFFREALRVARVAVVINDLERGRMHWWLAIAARSRYRSKLSAHDGPVSVRRAYTLKELDQMLTETGHPFEVTRGFLFRLGAILWQPALAKMGATVVG